jgi:hypothetical protein
MVDIESLRKCLEFAVPVHDANRALMVTFRQDQFHKHFAGCCKPRRIGRDTHFSLCNGSAGRQRTGEAIHFHDTDPASPLGVETVEATEGWYVNTRFPRYLQQGLSSYPRNSVAINR